MTPHIKQFLFSVVLLSISACHRNQFNDCPFISNVVVFKDIDITLAQYNDLRFDRNFVYEIGGVSGLIIYKETGNIYRVFDRVSPITPDNPKAILMVDPSRFFISDTLNKATFDFEGNVISGPKNCPLIRYNVAFNSPFLSIRNF